MTTMQIENIMFPSHHHHQVKHHHHHYGAPHHGVDDSDLSLRIELRNSRLKIEELELEIEKLNGQVLHYQTQIQSKDQTIDVLKNKLQQEDEFRLRNENIQSKLNEYWKSRHGGSSSRRNSNNNIDTTTTNTTHDDDTPTNASNSSSSTTTTFEEDSSSSSATSSEEEEEAATRASGQKRDSDGDGEEKDQEEDKEDNVRDIVDEIQRWLFMEGGNLRDVESLLTQYCNFMRDVAGMPLDRLFIAGMMLHPQISAYVWKWEMNEKFNEHEVPHTAFEKPNYNPNEPFAVLLEGRAMEYRMNSETPSNEIPPGCTWFTQGQYKDYFALPMYYRGIFVGAMAWCTKHPKGFSSNHITIFHQSLAALSTVLRLHTNDIVLKTLMTRLQDEVKQQTYELSKTNKQLEEANKHIVATSRTQLKHFAMMSHEIRTPLNGIVGMSNLLLEEESLPQDCRESISMITCSADLLSAVVNDVLDYSKLVADKIDINTNEKCNILQCINPVIESTRLKGPIRQLQLRTTICPQLLVPSLTVILDGRRLQQILYNLLGNALKFGINGKYIDLDLHLVNGDEDDVTDDGEDNDNDNDNNYGNAIVYKGSSEEEAASPSTATATTGRRQQQQMSQQILRISVKDYGKGIKPDDMKKVFEPFQQSTSNDPNVHGTGTGLGLAITNHLIKAMDGTIKINSKVNQYCEFIVELPFFFEEFEDVQPQTQSQQEGNDDPSAINLAMTTTVDTTTTTIPPGSSNGKAKLELPATATATTNNNNNKKNVPPQLPVQQTISQSSKNQLQQKHCDGVGGNNNTTTTTNTKHKEGLFDNRINVLVAEDNTINQKVLNRTLQRLGIQSITIVDNGQKAVETSENIEFDLIFMDIDMPIMDGLEATKLIKERSISPKIVFLTAHALKEYRDKTTEIGADGFISKPFKLNNIKEMMTELFPTSPPSPTITEASKQAIMGKKDDDQKESKRRRFSHQ